MTAREYGDLLLRRLLDHAAQAAGASGAGLSLTDSAPRSAAAVGVAGVLDAAQWKAGEGPLWDAVRSGHQLVLPDPRPDGADGGGQGPDAADDPPLPSRYPALVDVAGSEAVRQVGALVATPGEWTGEEPVVFSLYFELAPTTVGLPDVLRVVDEYEGLLGSALGIVEYCAGEEVRAEQMLQMVQYRRVIEQAKGLVMAGLGGDAAAAFQTLSRASQHFNIRLRNLAVAMVEHVGGAPAEGPEDAGEVIVPSERDRTVAAQVWLALSSNPGGALTSPRGSSTPPATAGPSGY